ncbi:YdeI/OmpD-associated family protein [Niabella sp. CJ426]|uniref:YdeI/OmpD-associated family protein n=1 Tax=Niabella sp. CJ426 TaxID=3393740 RepID=UPI003D00FE66
MTKASIYTFTASLDLIGINPFVLVPDLILKSIFVAAGKEKGPIPVKGTVNKEPYTQTLVRFRGEWRLYINTSMLSNSPQRIGEKIHITIAYNNIVPPETKAPAAFEQALTKDKEAKAVYDQLAPYLRKEINRYLSGLKTQESIHKNVIRALNFLKGKERFIGRDKP